MGGGKGGEDSRGRLRGYSESTCLKKNIKKKGREGLGKWGLRGGDK